MYKYLLSKDVIHINNPTFYKSYVSETLCKISFEKLSPTMCFCFLVNSLEDLQNLKKFIKEIPKDQRVIDYVEKNSNLLNGCSLKEIEIEKDGDDF